ncbi:MAG: U32 family peptidase [Tidjanibacter sp.]|nr:U32 family peptidase [Tidjanibacter sp.]
MARQHSIELLAPARNEVVARAAIDCGADAIYIGGPSLGARRAAANSVEEIARVVEYAHLFGVRVYVTMNTLLYDNELAEAERLARELASVGVDALIVQDMSYLRMGLPIELHASTQTFNATAEQVAFMADCGLKRVVLERNLSLTDIRTIAKQTEAELEVFVHGAVCVGYSGRCFLSRSMGPRSGNRGDCMQACRLSWDLEDASGRKLLREKHLLSVCDMDLSERIGDLLDAGVCSFKIEGRLKDEAYVRNVVSYYRQRIDKELAQRSHLSRSSVGVSKVDFVADLRKTFSRRGGEYFFDGVRRGVAEFDTPKAMGERLGRISSVRGAKIRIEGCKAKLSAGDGLCYMTPNGLVGTNVNGIEGTDVVLNRADGLRVGVEIFRNLDHAYLRTISRARLRRALPVTAVVSATPDCLRVTYRECRGIEVEATICRELPEAENRDVALRNLRDALSKSGATIFDVGSVEIDEIGFLPFVPAGELSELRRQALDELRARISALRPVREHFVENFDALAPKHIGRECNVINKVAEEFYLSHGAERVEWGKESADSLDGEVVMTTRYCLRREMGECLKCGSKLRGPLYLVHGSSRYELQFDCSRCEMKLICK